MFLLLLLFGCVRPPLVQEVPCDEQVISAYFDGGHSVFLTRPMPWESEPNYVTLYWDNEPHIILQESLCPINY